MQHGINEDGTPASPRTKARMDSYNKKKTPKPALEAAATLASVAAEAAKTSAAPENAAPQAKKPKSVEFLPSSSSSSGSVHCRRSPRHLSALVLRASLLLSSIQSRLSL